MKIQNITDRAAERNSGMAPAAMPALHDSGAGKIRSSPARNINNPARLTNITI